ncbi:claudin-34-like, partial [Lepus europaeus]|uniref:claudin-34-like n=1 Tax=Lepus europaeus TaxID=9983 RepID=UPI002B47CD79
MTSLVNSANRQVAGFAVSTIGWLLLSTSMGLAEWRLWYMDDPSLFPKGVASVGIWRTCIYHHHRDSNQSDGHTKFCHRHTYNDTFLPLSIRVSQHLLLAASLLGLLGKAFIILALRNVYMGIVRANTLFNPFVASGVLYITASACVLTTAFWNYYSVVNVQGIAFPSSFHLPFQPDTQEAGSAILVAALSALLMLLSG